ncbi:MAG: PilZ domain-containing protein [Acidimicrobiales bacterium]
MLHSVEPGSRLTLELIGEDDLPHLLVATVVAGEDRQLVVQSEDRWFEQLHLNDGQEIVARWRGDGQNESSNMRLLDQRSDGESRLLLGQALASPSVNQRRHTRLREKRTMLWGDLELGALRPGTAFDMSRGGLRFHTAGDAPETGDQVALEVMLPEEICEISGTVVGQAGRIGGTLVRVEFDHLQPDELQSLFTHLQGGLKGALENPDEAV